MHGRRLAMLLALVLALTVVPAVPALGTTQTPATPTITLQYVWERPGLAMYGEIMVDGEPVDVGPVQLEASQDKQTWSPISEVEELGAGGQLYWTPSANIGWYYRVHFFGIEGVDPGYSRIVRLGYDNPLIRSARFTNPVAYDLKSLQQTAFWFMTGEPGTQAKLVVHGARSDGGDLVLFNKTVDYTHDPDPISWNGRDEKGQRLRSSGNYTWTLTVSMGGRTETKTGGVLVSRILFSNSGTSHDGIADKVTGYMVPGTAKVYLGMRNAPSGGDTMTIRLTGPSGFSTASRSFAAAQNADRTVVSTYSGSSAPRYRGVHALSVAARRYCDYTVTVIQ